MDYINCPFDCWNCPYFNGEFCDFESEEDPFQDIDVFDEEDLLLYYLY